MLHRIIGINQTENDRFILSKIKSNADKGKYSFYLVPEQHSVSAEIELAGMMSNRANYVAEVQNFSRLPNRIFKMIGGISAEHLNYSGKALIMSKALSDCAPMLSEYASSVKLRGFAERMLSQYDELANRGIDFESLQKASGLYSLSNPRLSAKLHDFGIICEHYNALIEENDICSANELERLAEALADFNAFGDAEVFISGFYDFTAPQYKIISELLKQADNVYITICMPAKQLHDNSSIYMRSQSCYDRLGKYCAKLDIQSDNIYIDSGAVNPSLCALAEGIFSSNEEIANSAGSIELCRCYTPLEEVTYVARQIRLAAISGKKYGNMAVLYRNDRDYADLIETVFEKYRIPVFVNSEKPLSAYSLSRAIICAVKIMCGDGRLQTFLDYLKTGFARTDNGDIYTLENYLLTWNLQGNRLYSAEPYRLNPDGFSENYNQELLSQVNITRNEVIAPLVELRSAECSTVRQAVAALVRFLGDINAYQTISEKAEAKRKTLDFSAANEYIQVWNMCIQALEQLSVTVGDDDFDDDFSRLAELAFSGTTVSRIPSSQDGVQAGNISLIRLENAEIAFVLGLNNGVFPQSVSSNTLLTLSEKQELALGGMDFDADFSAGLLDELFFFSNALIGIKDRLVCTYHAPRGDEAENELSLIGKRIITLCRNAVQTEFDSANAAVTSPEEAFGYIITHNDCLSQRLFDAVCEKKSFLSDTYGDRIKSVSGASNYYAQPRHLDTLPINGKRMSLSQTRFETYQNCRFSYFVKYMLRAETDKRAKFDSSGIGTFVHAVLEKYMTQIRDNGNDYTSLSDEESNRLVRKIADEYVELLMRGTDGSDARAQYLAERIIFSTSFVIDSIREELAGSLFKPVEFEYDINKSGYTLSLDDGTILKMNGYIDRVDMYEAEDGTKYALIIDYKTGSKEFKLGDVYQGFNGQMLVYLSALSQCGIEIDGKKVSVQPAGVVYMKAFKDKPIMNSNPSEREIRQKILDGITRNGLLVDDNRLISAMGEGATNCKKLTKKNSVSPESFLIIQRYLEDKYRSTAESIKNGNIEINPFCRGKNSCEYCDCAPVCRFEYTDERFYRLKFGDTDIIELMKGENNNG